MNGRVKISYPAYSGFMENRYMGIKDIAERITAFVGLILLFPIFIVIAAAIVADSRGPVFYVQDRNGLNGKIFRMYKFRTMTESACREKNIKAAVPGDRRITRIGNFLRRYSIDELPQLLNVVKGDMSLIGPRPLATEHNEYYGRIFANYNMRHTVKPGLTGFAQVAARRGAPESLYEMQKRLMLDLHYVDNVNPLFDFKIVLMTFSAVIFPDSVQ